MVFVRESFPFGTNWPGRSQAAAPRLFLAVISPDIGRWHGSRLVARSSRLGQSTLQLGMEVPGWPPDNIDDLARCHSMRIDWYANWTEPRPSSSPSGSAD